MDRRGIAAFRRLSPSLCPYHRSALVRGCRPRPRNWDSGGLAAAVPLDVRRGYPRLTRPPESGRPKGRLTFCLTIEGFPASAAGPSAALKGGGLSQPFGCRRRRRRHSGVRPPPFPCSGRLWAALRSRRPA